MIARNVLQMSLSSLGKKYPFLKAIDNAPKDTSRRIVFLLRLSPLAPFNVLNYILGATSISLYDYGVTLLGIIPGSIAFCFLGSTIIKKDVDAEAELGEGAKTMQQAILVVGAIISLAAVLYIFHYVKKALRAVGVEQPAIVPEMVKRSMRRLGKSFRSFKCRSPSRTTPEEMIEPAPRSEKKSSKESSSRIFFAAEMSVMKSVQLIDDIRNASICSTECSSIPEEREVS